MRHKTPTTSINVFVLEISNDIKTLFLLYVTNHKNRVFEIDLLYLEKDGNTHYCLIKNFDSLFNNNCNCVYTYKNCITIFTSSDALKNHEEICINHNYCKVKVPNNNSRKTKSASADAILKFEKHHFKSRLPVVIYADFEAMNIKLQTASPSDKQAFINNIFKQDAVSICFYTKSDYAYLFTSQYYSYE